jgi:hypothetical protein
LTECDFVDKIIKIEDLSSNYFRDCTTLLQRRKGQPMSITWRLIVATSFFLLGVFGLAGDCTWVQTHNTASADDAPAEKERAADKTKERKSTLDDVLVSRIDFSVKSAGAQESFNALADAVRKSLPGAPEDFAIVLVGMDLQMEGITKNQQIRNIDAKRATVAEVLTEIATKMNPRTTVRDPTERNQMVVWTIGPNPRYLDKKRKVILITTRSAAKKKGYRLPAAFLPEAERRGRLIIRGTPLAAAVAKEAEPPKKREFKWSEIISRETLEDEVKKVKLALDKDVTRPATFSRGGYKSARRHFSELAVLFGIIHQYDKMIRWQFEANDASQRFARTAGNCKVGTIQSFNEAKQRREDLSILVRGDRLAKVRRVEDRKWDDLVDRSPLMQRMERVLSDELSVQLADAKLFAKNSDNVRHSAELIAAIAKLLGTTEHGRRRGCRLHDSLKQVVQRRTQDRQCGPSS